MHDSNLNNTQPSLPRAGDTKPIKQPRKPAQPQRSKPGRRWVWILLFVFLLGMIALIGALAGYQSAKSTQEKQALSQSELSLDEQFELGLQDLADGRYQVAAQRFEYILSVDPDYPGAPERLAEAAIVLYATATPTALSPTITPTPTRDPRPIEELYNQAVTLSTAQDWDKTIEILLALRKEDPGYQAARVDGLLYLSLRQRGVYKILNSGNLEGGIYDLALAEAFGPIDVEASQAREWARFYIIGLSFWEVYPEQAVFYFAQVAAAAPYLSDASGWTSTDRYRAALIQYGDLLASQEAWCQAQTQYELALNIRGDATLQQNWQITAERCLLTTVTPTLPASGTPTATGTPGPSATPTATATIGLGPSATPTATILAPTDTQPPATATTPPAGDTSTPTPTATPTATSTQGAPQVTDTPPYPPPLLSAPVQDNAGAIMASGQTTTRSLYDLWRDLLKFIMVNVGWDKVTVYTQTQSIEP